MIYWHSSESMHEVADHEARLLLGASVYLGPDSPWSKYEALYRRVYIDEGLRVLRHDGWFLQVQTDAYENGEVFPRNLLVPQMLREAGFRLLDVKVWRRRRSDWFQPPFSQVFIWGPPGSTHGRRALQRHRDYFPGVWEWPQVRGGGLNNGYPAGFCTMIVEAFTQPGDLVVDPFAGSGRLIAVAEQMGRRAIGYEIDESLRTLLTTAIQEGAENGR